MIGKIMLLLSLVLPAYALGQNDLRKAQLEMIGKNVSELIITDYLQNKPTDTNYTHKFKVLEFWATWCKPCLKAVPHLNYLQKKFLNKNIVFLSFTHESPEKALPVLKKINFETIVVSDQTMTTYRNLKVQYNGTMGLPITILIDDENKIVWYGVPDDLTVKKIQNFLDKKNI